tara:strand:- start:2866 stop:4329 length:1464 start_codon:yes stop_codon:yes gene_type:complete
MAINYTGTGGLFVRLGKIFEVAKVTETFQATCLAEVDDVLDVFVNDVGSLWQVSDLSSVRDSFASPMYSRFDLLSNLAKRVVMESVKDGLLLQPRSFQHALQLLKDDMKSGSTKTLAAGSSTNTLFIEANTVSASLAGSVVSGGGTLLQSLLMPMSSLATSAQKNNQGMFVEAIKFECVRDEAAGTNPGEEIFKVTGKERVSAYDGTWPLGSGTSTLCQVVSAATSIHTNSQYPKNLLDNSGFDTWSSATQPIQWVYNSTRASGSFGTGGHDSSSNPVEQKNINFTPDGDYSLEFNGDGNELHRIYQDFGKAAGTLGRIKPDRTYIFSCRIRSTSGTISAGNFTCGIKNSSFTAISTATQSLNFGVTNITDSTWVHFTSTFQTDTQDIGTDARLVVEFTTTALQTGKSLIVDEMVLCEPKSLYAGGPAVALVRGSADFQIENTFTLTVANNNSSEMQRYFRKLLNTENTGFQLPVAGGTEMADSLIG